MTDAISDQINFHDSTLVKIRLSDRLDQIVAVVYTPNAGEEWERGRFYELTFDAVLRFEFEVLGIGEPDGPRQIYDIYLRRGEELTRWRERLDLLAEPDSYGYRCVSKRGYCQVYR